MGRNLITVVRTAGGSSAAPLVSRSAAPAGLKYVFRTFDVPGAAETQVKGINDAGVIEGAVRITDGGESAGSCAGADEVAHRYPQSPAGDNAPSHGTVTAATDDRLTLTGFYFTTSGTQHGLLA